MYVHTYIRTYIRSYACACTFVYVYVRTYIRTYEGPYVPTPHIHTDVHKYVHAYVRAQVRIYVRAYVRTIAKCVRAYERACVHTYGCTNESTYVNNKVCPVFKQVNHDTSSRQTNTSNKTLYITALAKKYTHFRFGHIMHLLSNRPWKPEWYDLPTI